MVSDEEKRKSSEGRVAGRISPDLRREGRTEEKGGRHLNIFLKSQPELQKTKKKRYKIKSAGVGRETQIVCQKRNAAGGEGQK